MKFTITGVSAEGEIRKFYYDNVENALSDDNGPIAYPDGYNGDLKGFVPFSKDQPLKKQRNVALLKIQLGLSCNYSCDYCSQRFVERPPETSKKDIEEFMRKLDNLNFIEQNGLHIEFWGGEPLVYWKTLKPLVEALNKRFSSWRNKPGYSIITNGSLLNREICHWLYINNFTVSISHDGPGQSVRGPDPLSDPEKRKTILDFYQRMRPQNRISFNSMMHKGNPSRKAVYEFFADLTGDKEVPLGEGTLVDAYDDGGMSNALRTKAEHFAFRKQAFSDISSTDGNIGFRGIVEKIDQFTRSMLSHVPASTIGQKCGMDNPHALAIDLRGNVLTCQNVSATAISHNGESHNAGSIEDMKAVRVKTSTHWSSRPHCSGCPVLHLCRGSCMFLEGENWTTSCANSYTDNVALFALSIQAITGFAPFYIQGGELPLERRDIWGDIHEHAEETPKKLIPIKVVNAEAELNGVKVFTKSEVKDVV